MVKFKDIIELIEYRNEPCEYVVFHNRVLIPKSEYTLYADAAIESLAARKNFEDKAEIAVYII